MSEEKKNICLIDADSLCFYSSKENIAESLNVLNNRIDEIVDKTNADEFILFLTGSKCFRNNIYPEYKQNRKDRKPSKTPLKYLKTLKSYMIEEYKACLVQELEADDLVAYFAYSYFTDQNGYIPTISSPDKDVIYQLVGKHWNYQYVTSKNDNGSTKLEDIGSWIITDQKSADRFLALQLLMGDTSDNVPGLLERTQYIKERFGLDNRRGIGKATAEHILNVIDDKYNSNYAKEIANCYISKYLPEHVKEEFEDSYYRGMSDYNLNLKLLKLNTTIVKENKILEHYDIESHLNVVSNSSVTVQEDDKF